MPLPPGHAKHASLFHPHLKDELDRVERHGIRFVHYTSADSALKILTSQTLWLRQTTLMNDSREVAHGLECLHLAYESSHGQQLRKLLDDLYPGITREIEGEFRLQTGSLQFGTFVSCLSEHGGTDWDNPQRDAFEDHYGRLSMWRAYGRGSGVALVINQRAMLSPTQAMGAFTSPVAYMNPAQVALQIGQIAASLDQNREYLQQLHRDGTKRAVLAAFQAAAVCTKHPGFAEEREWRIVSMPGLIPPKRLEKLTPTLGGIPQAILSLKLADVPEDGLSGVSLPSLINRVIIGPTEASAAIYGVIHDALDSAGIPDFPAKLAVSHIPLRGPVTAG